MKKYCLFFSLLMGAATHAQQFATTEDGKRIRLNENGTWQFAEAVPSKNPDSATKLFSKPQASTIFAKSAKNRFAFWYDKSIWKVSHDVNNEAAEFELSLLKGEAFAMFISEKVEIDLENLKAIALKNAREQDPNTKLDKEETRIINEQKVKFLQMSGEAHGVKFVYVGYYTSNNSGTLQFVCFTSRNLFKSYESDFQNLLNGLVVSAQ
jgi:hypothetical protein